MAKAPTPFDEILAIAQNANTEYAHELFVDIRDLIERGAEITPWVDAVQLARDVGALGGAESHFLLDRLTESAIGFETGTDEILVDLRDQMEAINRQHGLDEDDDFMLDDAPSDWLELNRQWDRRFQSLREVLFRRIGEPGMARDIVLRPDEFEARSAEGWRALLEVPEEEDPIA